MSQTQYYAPTAIMQSSSVEPQSSTSNGRQSITSEDGDDMETNQLNAEMLTSFREAEDRLSQQVIGAKEAEQHLKELKSKLLRLVGGHKAYKTKLSNDLKALLEEKKSLQNTNIKLTETNHHLVTNREIWETERQRARASKMQWEAKIKELEAARDTATKQLETARHTATKQLKKMKDEHEVSPAYFVIYCS